MEGIAHLNLDGVVKIAVKRTDFIQPTKGKFEFSPGVGQMDVKSAIELFNDLLYSSNRFMISEVKNESLNKALFKAEKFTLTIKLDPDTGVLSWM